MLKGVIAAGGNGTRLRPLTRVTNKHLLPVYNKPMIYYPLQTLVHMGIKDILIISGKEHAGDFLNLLGSGREFGVRLQYELQDEAGGIAQVIGLGERFAENQPIAVILGDNIFEDVDTLAQAAKDFAQQKVGAKIFLKEVDNPQRFGVAEIAGDRIVDIVEKPSEPKSNWAVTGLYLYDPEVFDIIRNLKPSARGELEVTDVNNAYIRSGRMTYQKLTSEWTDAGTFASLLRATNLAARIADAEDDD
ncbi:MAG: sugar phosphate nucleotidyltransferase [Capsulimonadaceae bacterium]